MIKNYLKVTFRSLLKNKGFSIINITGLSTSMAICLMIVIFIKDQKSSDQFHKNKELERGLQTSDLEEWGRDVGVIVNDMASLRKAIQYELEHPREKSEIRRAFAQRFFYKPGKATQRAIEKIYQLLSLPL